MFELPPIPTWDSLHPLIIHFPIALLFLCPLFIGLSAVLTPPKGRPFLIAALIVLLLGTASLFIAASTGKAAGELADRGGPVDSVLASHEDLASETRLIFSGLSAILLGMFFLPRILRRQETRIFSTVLPLAFLVLYSVGILFLVNTSHKGGLLVHEFGVHALPPDARSQPEARSVAADTVMNENKD
ncbi:MAG: hypothetical protein KGM96_13530 [Acidobacteriota bacterium]|nr:hypothetical protein [Acidobacteriota bacterium]